MFSRILFNGFSVWKRVGRGDYLKRSITQVVAGPEDMNMSATNGWKKTCSDRGIITAASPAGISSKTSLTPQPSAAHPSVKKDVD